MDQVHATTLHQLLVTTITAAPDISAMTPMKNTHGCSPMQRRRGA
jgi:hypothetical protein